MCSKEEIIPALATWLVQSTGSMVAAVQLPMGLDSGVIKDAVTRADFEPVYVSMHGLAGVDLASAARSPIAVTFKKKVIVVFEYDAIASSDQSTMLQVSAAIKLGKVPVVLVGTTFKAKAIDVPKHATMFVVESDDPHDHVRAISKFSGKKDSMMDKGLAGAEAALRGVQQDYRGDGIALGGVFDNYLHAPTPGFAAVADAFSWADVVSEGMCRGGMFEDVYSFVPVSTAAHAFRDVSVPIQIVTFGTVWSKTNAMYAKVNNAKNVTKNVADVGKSVYLWKTTDGLDHIRGMIVTSLKTQTIQDTARLVANAGLDAASLLSLMRLWKSKYTLATHAKLKKYLN
jgi:hypothetical protein